MRFEAGIDAVADAPHQAREIVRDKLVDLVPATTLADVLTVVSELVANAVNHGNGRGARLSLEVLGESVAGWVENEGAGLLFYEEPVAHDFRGLGLHIVNAVATTWGVERGDEPVTRVTFEVAFP